MPRESKLNPNANPKQKPVAELLGSILEDIDRTAAMTVEEQRALSPLWFAPLAIPAGRDHLYLVSRAGLDAAYLLTVQVWKSRERVRQIFTRQEFEKQSLEAIGEAIMKRAALASGATSPSGAELLAQLADDYESVLTRISDKTRSTVNRHIPCHLFHADQNVPTFAIRPIQFRPRDEWIAKFVADPIELTLIREVQSGARALPELLGAEFDGEDRIHASNAWNTLNELHHKLLQPAIFTNQDVTDFAAVWFKARRDPSGQDHKQMNAILDRCVTRFTERDEGEQEEFRGLLTAFRNLYGFLSQILPYFDEELERLYAFVRNLGQKLPRSSDGVIFTLDDDVALKFFRLQQVNEGTIDLTKGEVDPLKGPTDVGTGREKDIEVALSTLVDQLNERFGTDFTEADQLFFDQVRATAEQDEKVVEAAKANTEANFSAFFGRILDDLFIQRMEGNDEIFNRVMNDKQFRDAAQDHLAREVYERIRGGRQEER